MSGKDKGKENVKLINHQITAGDGRTLNSLKMGDSEIEFAQKERKAIQVTPKDVKLIVDFKIKLLM
jgi:uncharacterized ubiquitin-like protein YukD